MQLKKYNQLKSFLFNQETINAAKIENQCPSKQLIFITHIKHITCFLSVQLL